MRDLSPNPCPVIISADDSAGALGRLCRAINHEYAGRITLVSSFGAEAIVLLHMVATIDPDLPILLNETGMLFAETLDYQREVAATLRLSDVRLIRPTDDYLLRSDPEGTLHRTDANACCQLRKVAPLQRALKPFAAWITGRKRFQSDTRAAIPFVERDGESRVKLNPLADWMPEDVANYMDRHELPRHPLVARGYRSIGCAPCTSPVRDDEDARAGRWRGQLKSECGIHFKNGKAMRGAA
ncbi:MAG: phosphoadenosine phosphosulfate reductase [Alphaproteobacteria bacterium BRH_c36]|nr:MAG: phosphoadenosine phosphosulfate reductase [Alphaproteobacteria bacterium BRH_c36]